MEFSTKRMQAWRVAKIAELMAEEVQEKLGSGAQIAEIEQAQRAGQRSKWTWTAESD